MIEKIKQFVYKTLRRSENIFKIDMVYLATGGFWLTIGQVVSTLSSFALSLVLANFISKEIYGTYRLALSIAGIFSIFSLTGMGDTITRSVAKGYDKTLLPATKARIKSGSIGALIVFLIALYYFYFGNITLTITYLITAIFLPFFDPFSNYGAFLQGKKNFKVNTVYGLAVHIFSIVVMIASIFLSGNLYVILISYFGSYTILRYIFYIRVKKMVRNDSTVDPEALVYGKHLSFIAVLSTIASQIDKVILFHILGPVEVAIYSIAISASDQMKQGLTMMDKLLFPRFSAHSEELIRKNIHVKMTLYFLASLVAVAFYILIAPWFFSIFYPHYKEAVFISQLFSLSMLNSIFGPISIFLEAHGMIKEQYSVNVITSIFQIVSMIVLTYTYGLMGIIIARIVTRFFGGFINLYFYYKPFKHSDVNRTN